MEHMNYIYCIYIINEKQSWQDLHNSFRTLSAMNDWTKGTTQTLSCFLFVSLGSLSSSRCICWRPKRRLHPVRRLYTVAIFDFFRRKGQVSDEQSGNIDKNNKLLQYIVERSASDWNQVVKFGKGLEKTRENWSKQLQRVFTTVGTSTVLC